MNQDLVFFVGPDMTGKTQIAQATAAELQVPYFKATSEHTSFLSMRVSTSDQFLNQLRFADPRVLDMLRQTGHSVVFDRGFPCEYAYSKVFCRETDVVMLRHLDEEYAKLGACVIFCHRSSYEGLRDDLDSSIGHELLSELHAAYEDFVSWSKCSVLRLNVDDEDLNREVTDVVDFVRKRR
jgi:deoxyadenosine/deoxycytidine kinase